MIKTYEVIDDYDFICSSCERVAEVLNQPHDRPPTAPVGWYFWYPARGSSTGPSEGIHACSEGCRNALMLTKHKG